MTKPKRKKVARKRAGTPKGRSGSSAKALRVAEQLLLAQTGPKTWIEYILKSGRGRWPEAERKMLQKDVLEHNVCTAIEYATTVIRGRWPELEEYLGKLRLYGSTNMEALYATAVLHDKALEVELLRIADQPAILDHIRNVRKRRWKAAEHLLANHSHWQDKVWYAETFVLPDVWQELEDEVLHHQKNWMFVIDYLRDVRKIRCPECERELLELASQMDDDTNWSYADEMWNIIHKYAVEGLAGRWHELEAVLLARLRGDEWRNAYGAFYHSLQYARAKGLSRWPELEEVFKQYGGRTDAEHLGMYAEQVIGGKLPAELHNRMLATAIKDPKDRYVKRYLEFIQTGVVLPLHP